jgi:proteasome lid subunit RPN8/RPN11
VSGTPGAPLAVAAAVLDAIRGHAAASWPRECCGLLIGDAGSIEGGWPARNLAGRAGRFLVDPRDHLAAIRAARASGRTVVGAYHSHVSTPPLPSRRDFREAIGGGLVHVIVGPLARRASRRYRGRPGLARRRRRGWEVGSITAWRIGSGNFVPVPLVAMA